MNKPRVIFPYTEAGFGHIMPMRSVADEFERLYGDKVECVRSDFFTEGGDEKLIKLQDGFKKEVIKYNKSSFYGYLCMLGMNLVGPRGAVNAAMSLWKPGAKNGGIKHMDELAPDLVVSTHWATNYFAKKCKSKPLTAMYCPDAHLYDVFRYPCDLTLISAETGYKSALKHHPLRYNKQNLKLVPFLIRSEVFSAPTDKRAMRKKLGLDPDKFTVVLAEGGYGVGKMATICKLIIERDLPVTIVPVCGKNTELYKELLNLKVEGQTDCRPMGLVTNIFEVLATADLFCGKSGASMIAETCFFGIPQIITEYATSIEQHNGEYYVKTVKSAMRIFKSRKVVDKIEEFLQHPERLNPFKEAAAAQHANYGATEAAKEIYKLLLTRFPELDKQEIEPEKEYTQKEILPA